MSTWMPKVFSAQEVEQKEKRLSLLICSVSERAEKLQRLLEVLTKQITNEVEILHLVDDGEMTIGEKRNELCQAAVGEYCAFIDDDDMVSDDYVEKVLKALESSPDCATLTGIVYFPNGSSRLFDHSIEHDGWFTGQDGNYYRTPNHLNAIKTEIVQRFGFKLISFGEDQDFAKRVRIVLHKEVRIPGQIYYYYPSKV